MRFDRRATLALLAAVLAAPASAQTAGMSRMTAFGFSFAGLDGADIRLGAHAGKPGPCLEHHAPEFTKCAQLVWKKHDPKTAQHPVECRLCEI